MFKKFFPSLSTMTAALKMAGLLEHNALPAQLREHKYFVNVTKKGPGRMPVQATKGFWWRTWTRMRDGVFYRYRAAMVGGNWQGLEYITYAEHDEIKRLMILGCNNEEATAMVLGHTRAVTYLHQQRMAKQLRQMLAS